MLSREELLEMVEAFGKSLSARVKVENQIANILAGNFPLPDKEKLKEWAILLGVPEDDRLPPYRNLKDDSFHDGERRSPKPCVHEDTL
jgi:transcriptional regulator with XRE-family HTH domain